MAFMRVCPYVRRGYLYRRRQNVHVSMSPRDPGRPGTIYWSAELPSQTRAATRRAVICLWTDDLRLAVRRADELVRRIERSGVARSAWTDYDRFLHALARAGARAETELRRRRGETE